MSAYAVTIPGNPGAARLNGRSTPIRRGDGATVILSAQYKAWRALAVPLMRRARAGRDAFFGPVVVQIETYWPKAHRTGWLAGLPLGDVDACCKAVLDALQHAGVYSDDGLVVALRAFKEHDAAHSRVVVLVEEYNP